MFFCCCSCCWSQFNLTFLALTYLHRCFRHSRPRSWSLYLINLKKNLLVLVSRIFLFCVSVEGLLFLVCILVTGFTGETLVALLFSLSFLNWNKMKFHIIHAWNTKIELRTTRRTRPVLKLPSEKLMLLTLDAFKPNQNTNMERILADKRATTNKTL